MNKVVKDPTPSSKKSIPTTPQKTPSPNPTGDDKTKIYIRARPILNTEEWSRTLKIKDGHNIHIIKPDFEAIKMKFDGIFTPDFVQKDIFKVVEPAIVRFLNGESHSFFAYGQTGAGKTYTMMGDFEEKNPDFTKFLSGESRGILPRSLLKILKYIHGNKCRLWASFYEVYNDKIFDLLNSKSRLKKGGLDFRENPNGYNTIVDLQQMEINTIEDVLNCLQLGLQNRVTGCSHGNSKSSRSHSIFQLKLVQADPNDAKKTIISQLNIVDLAGSEKFVIPKERTPDEKELHIAELTSINGSLSALGLCISALTDPKRSHIPFRSSKLTRVLSDALSGTSKITFIVCMSPAKESMNETLSTLMFASRAKKIVLEGRKTSKHTKQINSVGGTLLNEFRELCQENGLLQEQCDISTQKKIITIETEIQQLHRQNANLKNELQRLERSVSPQKHMNEVASTTSGSLRSITRRSVSPYQSAPRTLREHSLQAKSPTLRRPETSRIQSPSSAKKEEKENNKNKGELVINKAKLSTMKSMPTRSEKSPFSHRDSQDDKYTLKGKFRIREDKDILGQIRPEKGSPRMETIFSIAQKNIITKDEPDDFDSSKISQNTPSSNNEIITPEFPIFLDATNQTPITVDNTKSLISVKGNILPSSNLRSPKSFDRSNSMRHENQPEQTPKSIGGHNLAEQNKKLNDSLTLHEWSALHDSKYLKEEEHAGFLNTHEISAISQTARSCDISGVENLLKSPANSVKGNKNIEVHKEVGVQNRQDILVDPIKEKEDKDRSNSPLARRKSSKDYNGDQTIIEEINKKLSSVHELNQQHQSLIRNLSVKFGDMNSGKTKDSARRSKTPTSAEREKSIKDLDQVVSGLKKEVSTALLHVESLQSGEAVSTYTSVSGHQEGQESQKPYDASQFYSLPTKSDTEELSRKRHASPSILGASTNRTNSIEKEVVVQKSQVKVEPKSVMDIIAKHWDKYKNVK